MKKLIFFCLSLLIFLATFSQEVTFTIGGSPTQANKVKGRLYVDSALYIPFRDTNWIPLRLGAQTMRPQDSLVYVWSGHKWNNIGTATSFGTVTNVSRINAWGITASIANPTTTPVITIGVDSSTLSGYYLRRKDSTLYATRTWSSSTFSALNHTHLFAQITDGTTAVRNLFSGGTDISYNPLTGVISATGTLGKLNISDTAAMLLNYRHWLAGYVTRKISERWISDWRKNNWETALSIGATYRDENKQTVTLNTSESLLHQFINVNDTLFAISRQTPNVLIRFKNPNDLTQYDTIKFTGYGDCGGGLDLVSANGKIYVPLYNNACDQAAIAEVNSSTLAWSIVFTRGNEAAYQSIVTDGSYLYCPTFGSGSNADSVIKINLSGFTSSIAAIIGSGSASGYIHAMRFDGTNLYGTMYGVNPGKIFQVRASDLATLNSATFSSGDQDPSDDLSFSGDYVWVPMETSSGFILKIKKSDLSITRVNTGTTGASYGIAFDGKYIWNLHSKAPGVASRINPETGEIYKLTLGTGEDTLNEMITDGQRLFFSSYKFPQSKVIRISMPSLTYVSGGSVPTLQQVTDVGASTTNPVAIGTSSAPNSKSVLDLVSTTKGFLAPRMTASQRLSISSPPTGLLVYDTDSNRHFVYNGGWHGYVFTNENGSGGITSLSPIGSSPNANGATITGNILNLEKADQTHGGVLTAGLQNIGGDKNFYGNIYMNEGLSVNGNFYATPSNGALSPNKWVAGALNNISFAISNAGTNIGSIPNANIIGNVFEGSPYLEASSGAHNLVANAAFLPISLGNGTATTTNGATVYIGGSAVGSASITNNYAFWVDSGTTRLDGDLRLTGLSTDNTATHVLGKDGSGNSVWRDVSSISGSSGATVGLDNLSGVAINAALVLGTSDAFALGSSTKQWSDLFLAEGGVINWDNGDATLTQSGNTVTLAGADLFVPNVTASAYLYGGDKTTTYSGYTGAILGGTATHAVLDFWDNNSRIGEFYTDAGSFNFFTDVGKVIQFYTNNDFSVPLIYGGSNQRVGINKTSPGYTFHVGGASGFENELNLKEISPPSTPGAGYVRIFPETDKRVYALNSDGTKTEMTNTLSGIATVLGYDDWQTTTVQTTTNATTTLTTIDPTQADGTGETEVILVSTKSDNAKSVTGHKIVQWHITGNTCVVDQTIDVAGDYVRGSSAATWTVDASGGTIRVRVTGVTSETYDWKAITKTKWNLYAL